MLQYFFFSSKSHVQILNQHMGISEFLKQPGKNAAVSWKRCPGTGTKPPYTVAPFKVEKYIAVYCHSQICIVEIEIGN